MRTLSDVDARPRVTIATRLFAPEVGAAAFRLRHLAQSFADAGWDVDVVTTRPPAAAGPADDGDLRVSRWPVLRDGHGNVRGYVQYLSFDVPLAARLLLRRRPALFVVEPPPTTGLVVLAVAALLRRPYAYYAADVLSDAAASAGAPRPVLAVLRTVERWVLRGATAVLTVSDGVAERVLDLGVDRAAVTVVGNGVDTAVFTPDGPAEATAGPDPYFVYTGTMSEWQGADVFVEALARHRERGHRTRAVFLGQGTDLPHLRALAARVAPGAVDFAGVQPPTVTARWIRGATAALVSIKPGVGYDFARPTKVYAATGCGVPVLFSGVGAARDLVTRAGLGWAVDHDVDAVADAMDAAVAGQGTPDAEHLVAWTGEHASLRAVTRAAVEDVVARVRRAPAPTD